MQVADRPLRIRWLGSVRYAEAWDLQRALFEQSPDDHLLLLEHPDTVTLGVGADPANVLVDAASYNGDIVGVDRGGDVTYHGPGQLVGYPIMTLADHAAGQLVRTRDYIEALEALLIETLVDLGLEGAATRRGCPGVWLGVGSVRPRKIAAVGVRIERGRTMHGFALNVDTDLGRFDAIVPCGLTDSGVTSLAAEGVDVPMRQVVDALCGRFIERFASHRPADRADVAWRTFTTDLSAFSQGQGPGDLLRYSSSASQSDGTSIRLLGRLAEAGVGADGGAAAVQPKPAWMRAKVRIGPEVLATKKTIRDLGLVTVCEEAGCPNLSECWSEGTATFMVCGERCTRACGFCLVDTRQPGALDPSEPDRVAEAVGQMGLRHAVITMVARDDLDDGGAAHVAATVRAIRAAAPACRVEVLISDLAGSAESLELVLSSGPDLVNHNIETVARLQRAARPSASYARSLALLGRSKAAGFVTKSGVVVGMGETADEVVQTMTDLRSVGVDLVTIGQYLRPTSHHLPVVTWWTPAQFEEWKRIGEDELGVSHVESSPFTRSSHHAGLVADAALGAPHVASGNSPSGQIPVGTTQ